MLKQIIDQKLFSFHENFNSWEEAIKASYVPMLEQDIVTDGYVKTVIDCVHKYGPYIVIIPDVALPHAQENAEGVKGTCVGFMKVNLPVVFDAADDSKNARLFFPIASKDHETHLDNIARLSDLLTTDGLVEDLLEIGSEQELLEIVKKYKL